MIIVVRYTGKPSSQGNVNPAGANRQRTVSPQPQQQPQPQPQQQAQAPEEAAGGFTGAGNAGVPQVTQETQAFPAATQRIPANQRGTRVEPTPQSTPLTASQPGISPAEGFRNGETQVYTQTSAGTGPTETQVMPGIPAQGTMPPSGMGASAPSGSVNLSGLTGFEKNLYTHGLTLEEVVKKSDWVETPFSKAIFEQGLVLDLPKDKENASEAEDKDEEEAVPLYKKPVFWVVVGLATLLTAAGVYYLVTKNNDVPVAPQSEQSQSEEVDPGPTLPPVEEPQSELPQSEAAPVEVTPPPVEEPVEEPAPEAEGGEEEPPPAVETEEPKVEGNLTIKISAPDGANMGYIVNGASEKTEVSGSWTKDFPLADLKGPVNIIVKGRNGETPVTCEILKTGTRVSNGFGDDENNEATCEFTP